MCLIRWTFFGLDTKLRRVWQDEIFYLQRHGGGGFTFSDCYNMPTQMRKYNVRKLSAEISEENTRAEEAKRGSKNISLGQMAQMDPSILVKDRKPDYIAKAPRK